MRILLLNPNNILDKILGSGKIFTKPDVPIGLSYIGAILKSHGHEIIFRDSYLHDDSYTDALSFISKVMPDIIGITCLTATGKYVFELGQLIKKHYPRIIIVLGNIHPCVFSEFYLNNNAADIIVHGEGEYTFLEISDAVSHNESYENIKGITWKNNGVVKHNPSRPFIENLDMLPFPYLDEIDYSAYPRLKRDKRPYNRIISSRGCINKCTFCAVHNGRKYRYRSAQNIVAEIKYNIDRFKIKYFAFEDALFTANERRIFEFCDILKHENLDIRWVCEGHINSISETLIKAMVSTGCEYISFGIESGNQRILDQIQKKTNLNDIEETVRMASRYVNVVGLFIIGLPGENADTITETIKLALRLPLSSAQFSMFTPYPGTELYEELKRKNIISIDENDSYGLVNSWERYSSYSIFAKDAPPPIYLPDGMTHRDINKYQKKAFRKFYFRLKHILKNKLPYEDSMTLRDLPNLMRSVANLFT
jgi:anaerobic magnesium-protoporphyrin IX monomethyl ester cyclase